MSAPTTDIINALAPLVGFNTTNPPREIAADGPLIQHLKSVLPGFDIEVTDHGGGSIVFDATRGDPDVLFNVHLDTVPIAPGWERDPFSLSVEGERVFGLGACDIKGAAACLIVLAARTDVPMRLVFTTDEEAGQSTCIRKFLETPTNVSQAVIAEPTGCQAVLQHRGIFSAQMSFAGESGHSSGNGRSAVHAAAHWITRCLADPAAAENRFNVGRIEGGIKANMIAAEASVLFGFRNIPGTDRHDIFGSHFANESDGAETTIRFNGPALPNSLTGLSAEAQQKSATWAEALGLSIGEPVDFFTEAAFFAEAGIPAVVLGPGHIEQAHTADEWVAVDQLLSAYSAYERIVTHGKS